jgi:putative phosphoesterase
MKQMKSHKFAVISDTHVPDFIPNLSNTLLDAIRAEKPDMILHAGDICISRVLSELEKIAPVIAVRGNRDFLLRKELPKIREFEQFGVKFALMHGHIDLKNYLWDKVIYIFQGYNWKRYCERLPKAAPGAQIYVYGHTHHPENFERNDVLFFNPGSVAFTDRQTKQRSWGVLEVFEDGRVEGKIIPCE